MSAAFAPKSVEITPLRLFEGDTAPVLSAGSYREYLSLYLGFYLRSYMDSTVEFCCLLVSSDS